jgi:hypothetical protein
MFSILHTPRNKDVLVKLIGAHLVKTFPAVKDPKVSFHCFLIGIVGGGWSPIGSSRHCGHY